MNKRNIETHSRNHSCRGKEMSITHSECVFVALVIQHVTYIIVVSGLSGCTMCFQAIL